jgi:triosephosphate isomerase
MADTFKNEKFIVANFKQSGSRESSIQWIQEFKKLISEIDLKINLVLCPSYPFLELFYSQIILDKNINKGRIFLGSQNISSNSSLENTGEVGALNLKELITFSIIGHSERKENFDEVSKKYHNCLENGIVPIVCFYENKRVFELENCLFAYEDPKAISQDGVYKEKSFDELMGVRNELKEFFDGRPILYGGSVNKNNVEVIQNLEFFKGVLVGRSSLIPAELIDIIRKINN